MILFVLLLLPLVLYLYSVFTHVFFPFSISQWMSLFYFSEKLLHMNLLSFAFS